MSGAKAIVAALALLLLAAPAPGAARKEQATLRVHTTEEVQERPAKQHTNICNAYASIDPLDIYRGGEQLNYTPLTYKECRSFELDLHEGEELTFKTGSKFLGSFSATELPKNPASLLLVAHRRDQKTNFIAFQSHIFSTSRSPQIAVIDAYRGTPQKGEIEIADQDDIDKDADDLLQRDARAGRGAALAQVARQNAKPLQYNTVLALGDGKYNFALVDAKGQRKTESMLEVSGSRNYVAMRVGSGQKNFDQDLVVMGAAGRLRPPVLAALAIALLSALGILAV